MLEELVFWIRTKFDGADQDAKAATSALQQTGQAIRAVQERAQTASKAIGQSLNEASAQTRQAAENMSNQYNGMSFNRLLTEFDKIEDKIGKQEQILKDAQAAVKEYASIWEQVMASGTRTASSPEGDPALQALKQSANEAEAALRSLQTQQEQVATAMVNSKEIQAARQELAQSKLGIDSVAMSLSTLSYASGGAVGQITGLVQQIRFLKKGFTETAKTAGSMTAAVTTGVGALAIGITVITSIVSSIAQAREEARRLANESVGAYSVVNDELLSARRYIDVLKDQTASLGEVSDAKEQLRNLFPHIISGYGEEENAVKKIIGSLEDELAIRQQLADFKTAEAAASIDLIRDEWKEKQKQVDGYKAYYKDLEATGQKFVESLSEAKGGGIGGALSATWDYIFGTDAERKAESTRKETETFESLQSYKNAFIANVEKLFGRDMAAELDGPIRQMWSGFYTALSDGTMDGDAVAEAIDSKLNIMRIAEGMIADAEAGGQQLGTALKAGLVNALMGLESADVGSMQAVIQKWFEIDDAAIRADAIPKIDALRTEIISALAGQEGADSGAVTEAVNGILNAILGDTAQQEAFTRAQQLRKSITEGLATGDDMQEYDELSRMIIQGFVAAQAQANQAVQAGIPGAEQLRSVIGDVGKNYTMSAKEIAEFAAKEKAATATLKDAASELRSVASAHEQVSKAFKNVADTKAAVKAIQDYNSAANKSGQASKDAAQAKAYLADTYGVEKDAVNDMLPSIEDDIAMKEALALADYATAMAAASSAQAQIHAMVSMGTVTQEQGEKMIGALQRVIDKMAELGSSSVSVDGTTISPSANIPKVSRSGGGGGSKNKALDREMAQMEHLRALDQLTTAEEIANLERVLARYAKTTEEKRKLTEQLYALRKQKAQEDLEFMKAMDQLTLREEIAAMDRLMSTLKAGTEARRDLEVRRYEAQRQLERQEFELKVYYGQLTLQEQEAQLKQLIATYKEGVQARIDLEKQLYDVQQSIRQQNIDRLNSLTDAVVSALAERYEAQRKIEETRINESIKAWRDWGSEQVKAIEAQIKALDDLNKGEDRAEEERKKRRRIAALEQQMAYEQDEYNRRKLAEQLAAAQDDLQKWLTRIERDDLKENLREKADEVNERVKIEEAALQEQLAANNEYYEELTKTQNLQAEAQRMLMQSSQAQILDLLKAFAPDYNATGQTLGEQLVDGFMGAVGDIEAWFASFTASFTAYQRQLAQAATAAADQFYATHGVPAARAAAAPTGAVSSIQLGPIYFTEKEYTPTETRRELERLAEQLRQLL